MAIDRIVVTFDFTPEGDSIHYYFLDGFEFPYPSGALVPQPNGESWVAWIPEGVNYLRYPDTETATAEFAFTIDPGDEGALQMRIITSESHSGASQDLRAYAEIGVTRYLLGTSLATATGGRIIDLDWSLVPVVAEATLDGAVGAAGDYSFQALIQTLFDGALGAAGAFSFKTINFAVLNGAVGAATSLSLGVLIPAALPGAVGAAGTFSYEATIEVLLSSIISGQFSRPTVEDGLAAWVVNLEGGGSTRYESYPYNSFAKIGDSYYGCKADGIYQLDGDTDNGDPIQAMVGFGKQDFGTTALKRVTNLYLGTSSTGKLYVKVLVDDDEYLYAARDSSEDMRVQRVDVGRGLRASYLEFELYNADGDDFELASVEFVAVPLTRRI